MKRQLAILVLAFMVVFGFTSAASAQVDLNITNVTIGSLLDPSAILNATLTQAQAQAQTSTNTNNNNLTNVNVINNENKIGDITVASFNSNVQIQGRDIAIIKRIKNQINILEEDLI